MSYFSSESCLFIQPLTKKVNERQQE